MGYSSTKYLNKKKLFKIKDIYVYIYKGKITDTTLVMYKHTKTRNW